MNVLGLDIEHIVELGTAVAQSGAIRAAEMVADDVFEYVIGIAMVVYAMDPG
jgi:hypothetical protein